MRKKLGGIACVLVFVALDSWSLLFANKILGFWPTLALLLLGMLTGLEIFRRYVISFRRVNPIRRFTDPDFHIKMLADMYLGFAAFLLLLPGFVSDLVALPLFFPWARNAIGQNIYSTLQDDQTEGSAGSSTNTIQQSFRPGRIIEGRIVETVVVEETPANDREEQGKI